MSEINNKKICEYIDEIKYLRKYKFMWEITKFNIYEAVLDKKIKNKIVKDIWAGFIEIMDDAERCSGLEKRS